MYESTFVMIVLLSAIVFLCGCVVYAFAKKPERLRESIICLTLIVLIAPYFFGRNMTAIFIFGWLRRLWIIGIMALSLWPVVIVIKRRYYRQLPNRLMAAAIAWGVSLWFLATV